MRRFLLLLLFALSTTALAQGRTLACSTDVSTRLACYLEVPLMAVGPLEVAIGLDTLAAARSHVTPYLAGSWHAPTWSFTAEYGLPQIYFIGTPAPLRLSFTIRF